MEEQPRKMLFTAFECDRCGKDNAIRLGLAVNEDPEGNKVFQEADICSVCLIEMCGALFSKLKLEDREAWKQAFFSNMIK